MVLELILSINFSDIYRCIQYAKAEKLSREIAANLWGNNADVFGTTLNG